MHESIENLAKEVLLLSRNTLLVNLRFMDVALSQFVFTPSTLSFATDGHRLYHNSRYILIQYQKEKEASVRSYLHIVLHCVFRHMYINTLVDDQLWNLACDIAVEEVINNLNLTSTVTSRQERQITTLNRLRKEVKQLTAEKIYHWYQNYPPKDFDILWELFSSDDHTPWYHSSAGNMENNVATNDHSDCNIDFNDRYTSMEQTWIDISRGIQVNLEMFSNRTGKGTNSLSQNLYAVNREKYDYTAFLKKFAVRGEVMRLSQDEYDYVYYTYGLEVYKNMPLIEPLEYREMKGIRDFVIAIDTSGSVEGKLVQTFVQKTYNILKSTESFLTKINIHIIQCDEEIQEDTKITNQKEFDQYLSTMSIKGLGGTDFRPVFRYVDQLCREKEFLNLKGLIYFTDGYGSFPEKKPDYKTAFVFVEDGYNNPDVPSWAIKLVLQSNEL